MINYTDATEGDAYLDMTKVDTSVSLTVGCIQVVFLNKFVSSILVRSSVHESLHSVMALYDPIKLYKPFIDRLAGVTVLLNDPLEEAG